ncbi:MAG TPA: hypothetical protein VN256_15405 [Pyrinomonadaceae bacterium]|nr:hypothetical protein [Pyrinomonadaceae bacterium]
MSSTKCRACGLTNFSPAVVCGRCHYPLFGPAAQAGYLQAPQRRKSRRWILNAAIASVVLMVVLLFGLYFLTLIFTFQDPEQLQGGWVHFTPRQMRTMGSRYRVLLIIGLVIVWGYFYWRKDKYDL